MFSINRNFIRLPDKIVEVIRSFPEAKVKNVDGVHEWLGTDTLLRKNGMLYFCVKLDELEIVND